MMVDQVSVDRISTLLSEDRDLTQAIGNIDGGGRIVEMTIGPRPVQVNSEGFTYPPQMLEAIKAQISTRQTAVRAELTGLGFTGGFEPPAPPEGEAAAALRSPQHVPPTQTPPRPGGPRR